MLTWPTGEGDHPVLFENVFIVFNDMFYDLAIGTEMLKIKQTRFLFFRLLNIKILLLTRYNVRLDCRLYF